MKSLFLSLSLLFLKVILSLRVLCTFNLWLKANVLSILPFFSMNTIPIHGEMIVQTFEMMSHMLGCEGPNV